LERVYSPIIEKMREGTKHKLLKEKAKELLLSRGFEEEEIYYEAKIPLIGRRSFVVDVLAKGGKGTIAIECGDVFRKGKLEGLKHLVDEVIVLPYEKEIRPEGHTTIQINLTDEENKKVAIYKIRHNLLTKAEAIKEIIGRYEDGED